MSESLYPHPTLTRAHFEFIQDANTLGTTNEPGDTSGTSGMGTEGLDVFLEYQMPGGEDEIGQPFVVVKSAHGWSVSDSDELKRLIDACVAVHGVVGVVKVDGSGSGDEDGG